MEAIQTTLFDFAALDTETRIVVQQEDKEYDRNMGEAGGSFVRACHNLRRTQTALRYKRPGFVDYVNSKPGLKLATAYRMIDVAKMFPESGNIYIESKEALYLLAAPSTPDTAREEAIARAEEGEIISRDLARGIIHDHAHPAEPFTPEASQCPYCGNYHAYSGPRDTDRYGEYPCQRSAEWRDRFLRDNDDLGLENVIDEATGELIDIRPTRNQHIMQVMGSSESPEWYTPTYIVDLVLRFYDGAISVDPCSNSHERPNVPADVIWTKDDDGLAQPWHGNVYMNPPYGDEIGPWVERMVDLFRAGTIDQAIALLPGRIDTAWFQPLYDYPMCNVRGRVRFQNADNSAPFPSVIVYLGADQEGFIETFKQLGPIVKRIA